MHLRIECFTKQHELAAGRFNTRMREMHAPADFLLPETAADADPLVSSPVTKRQYVVLEGHEVRGGAILQDQPVWVGDTVRNVWNIQSPLSEGIANPAYGAVALFMMKELITRNPLMYTNGMGSESRPIARLLKALGWDIAPVPFFFWVRRARPFLHNLQMLRRDPFRRLLADLAAYSGLGSIAIHAYRGFKSKRPAPAASYHLVVQFDEWADKVWDATRRSVSFSIERTAAVLNSLLPANLDRLLRIRVVSNGATAGWAALLISNLRAHHYLGDMCLGTIVDVASFPGKERHVVVAALQVLCAKDVDLIVSYQTHEIWQAALRDSGFLDGPSNFLMGFSPKLAAAIPTVSARNRIHLNRADGDGICTL